MRDYKHGQDHELASGGVTPPDQIEREQLEREEQREG